MMKKMFKKRSILVSSLIVLLGVVCYFNHQLTQNALLQSSGEYRKYEEIELGSLEKEGNEKSLETTSENVEVVDSMESSKSNENVNYFVEHRLSRDKLRSEVVERLNKVIEDDKTSADIRADAQKELIEVGNNSEMELYIEGLVKGKGFEEVIVFFNADSARIIVDKENLEEQDVMKILEVVTSETKLDPLNIKIMKKQ